MGEDNADTLCAIFVDEDCRLIRIEDLGADRCDRDDSYPRRIFDRAYIAGAAGVIFARRQPQGSPIISRKERQAAIDLAQHGASCDVAVLDYIVIGGTEEKGLFALRQADRFE